MKIQLWKARGIPAYLITQIDEETGTYLTDEKHTRLVQTDWDYPNIARSFGWGMSSPNCEHSQTDGTIDCPQCHTSVSVFIQNAQDFLDNNLGAITEDEGYFD